jgi:hypothetical protein
MEASAGEENTPMVIAVNPPFCQLMNYSLVWALPDTRPDSKTLAAV